MRLIHGMEACREFCWGGGSKLISVHYSVYINNSAIIGKGFNLGHCFSIILSDCVVGDNVTVMQQVTIGASRGGKRNGTPIIGNNVFVGCGAKIIGDVKIGNNVIIGANAVVTKDVPDNAVVGGIPARVLNYDGREQVKHWCSDLFYYENVVKKNI